VLALPLRLSSHSNEKFAVATIPISLLYLIINLVCVLVVAMAPAASRIARAGWVPVAIPQPNLAPEAAPIDTEDVEITEEVHGSSFKPRGRNIDIVTRGIALAMFYNMPGPNNQAKYKEIEAATGVKERTLGDIKLKAIERGYDPLVDGLRITSYHVEDGSRTGPPRTAVNETNKRLVIEIVSKDKQGREKSAEVIGNELGVSRQSVCRIMKKLGYKKVKYTTKPGLNAEQKEKRLAFCRKYQDWTLEDWKNVIWSDETSVVIGQRRGSYKIWRRSDEGLVQEY
jgi:transposase